GRQLQPQVSRRAAAGVAEVLRRLESPLQVAVAGRIKSGKSTLVNALIGRRVAPTDSGECTRLVTRFQYGTVDRLELVLHDGGTRVIDRKSTRLNSSHVSVADAVFCWIKNT